MRRKYIVLLVFVLFVIFFLYRFVIYNPVLENTTQNIDVVSKEQNITTGEQWIVLSNDKQVYVEDFSIWALIQPNENYTIIYDLRKKPGTYKLRTIVPGDYNGQF